MTAAAPFFTPGFDLLAPGTARVAVLVAMRMGGLLAVAPLWSNVVIPNSVKAVLLVAMTVLIAPVVCLISPPALAPGLSAGPMLAETTIGLLLGIGAATLIGGAQLGGEVIAMHAGLSGAASLDPVTNESSPVMGQFLTLFVLTTVVSLNWHLDMVETVVASFRVIPLGGPADLNPSLWAAARSGSECFALGLRFASPVLAAGLLVTVGVGILSRAAPALQLLGLAFPVQIGLTFLVLAGVLPLLSASLQHVDLWYEQIASVILGIIPAAGPAGGALGR